MKSEKKDYIKAEIELIYFNSSDIITSSPTVGDNEDEDGWTAV